MLTATAPNAAIPIGLRKKPALDVAAEVKGHAAGVLHIAPDGDVLLLRRAGTPGKDNFVGHWALPGGGVEAGETPQAGAARENKEEMGVDVDPDALRDLDKTLTPNGMAFHTFAHPVAKKFSPQLNDEHSGAGWFGLHELPRPMHPAVEKMLQDKLGIGADSKPEEFAGARDGLMAWAKNPDIADDGALASDSQIIAMDRDSVRSIDRDGRMHVAIANLSKEQIRPYVGREMPGWEKLGLDPVKVYNLYCPGEELEKAAATFNGIQLLKKHTPVNADDHKKNDIVGTTGTNAKYVAPFLQNSLVVWTREGIDFIESEDQKELSCGYHYTPVMRSGVFQGQPFDGVMTDLAGNHVTLVEDGRAGDECVVGDNAEALQWAAIERAVMDMTA